METNGGGFVAGDEKLTVDIRVYAHHELKSLLGVEAKRDGVPLSEYIVRVLADHISRPDLRIIPRKSFGRPLGSKNEKKNGTNGKSTNGHARKAARTTK